MKNILKKIYELLVKPFTESFAVLLLISVLGCAPTMVGGYYIHGNSLDVVIWEAMHNYLLCYFALLLFSNINLCSIREYGKCALVVFAIIDFFIEVSCWNTTGSPFSEDIVAIIMATNFRESNEFISTYFSYELLIILLGALILSWLIYKVAPQIDKIGNKLAPVIVVITLISCGYFLYKESGSWRDKFYNKVVTFISYELPPDLREYKKSLFVECTKINRPQYVILIVGESFSRFHSSLYGYEKETNPCLTKLKDSSLLCVYNNAIAPATNTIPCIKSIMSTYEVAYGDSINWYECVTLPQILSEAGYKTIWISNQSPSGKYDNVAARYSELCDTAIWVGSGVKGVDKTDLDGLIIDELYNTDVFNNNCEDYFVVIHLMGSHSSFTNRYPSEWEIYSNDDYLHLPKHQRHILSKYDNSIRYNDFVVSEILNVFNQKECIAYYFSDHSLDLFNSDENYIGYSKYNNKASIAAGLAIPYMIYGSPTFQCNFAFEWECIKSNASTTIYSADTIDDIMDVVGIKYSIVD